MKPTQILGVILLFAAINAARENTESPTAFGIWRSQFSVYSQPSVMHGAVPLIRGDSFTAVHDTRPSVRLIALTLCAAVGAILTRPTTIDLVIATRHFVATVGT